MIKKFISEFIGAMLLVFFGCGTAVAINTYVGTVTGAALPFTLLTIALAFGLSLTAIIYALGKVSGAHVNPAVSVGCVINGRIKVTECIYYIAAQILGAITGAAILAWLFGTKTGLAANGFDTASEIFKVAQIPVTAQVALVVEAILTFVFVLVVLSATKKENNTSGLVIGLTLTLVHIFGIVITGTSVNPARSIGPALLVGGVALEQLWVFIVGPLIGAVIAGLFYRFVVDTKEVVAETPSVSKAVSMPSSIDQTQIDFDFELDEDELDSLAEDLEEVKEKKTTTKSKNTKSKNKKK